MKNKFRSYGFWTALAAAIVVLINALGNAFGFSVNDELITNIIMSIAGVLVVLGVVSIPKNDNKEDQEDNQEEQIIDNQEDKQEENNKKD